MVDIPFKFKEKTLLLIRGIPGSGKSTLAKKFVDLNPNTKHFEADMFFVDANGEYKFDAAKLYAAHRWCQAKTEEALRDGFSVVVSNTFTTRKELADYLDMDCEMRLVIACRGDWGNVHNVPKETLDRMVSRWQEVLGELIYDNKDNN